MLSNTGFPFLDFPVVLQWPDEAMQEQDVRELLGTSNKICRGDLGLTDLGFL